MEVGGVGKHSGSRWKPSGTTLVDNKLSKKDFLSSCRPFCFQSSTEKG